MDFSIFSFFTITYYLILSILFFYGLHRYYIGYLYYKYKNQPPLSKTLDETSLPIVLIQLPVYNERFVVKRLIQNICKIDYPKHLLYIQVLDDSTDDSHLIAQHCVQEAQSQGFFIDYIHRDHRIGFKAGALDAGMKLCPQADFIAIFDADFIPNPLFLRQMLPYFIHDHIGMVQSRWSHLNRDYSLLTQVQAILLDGHFMIEHTARHRSGRFFNFNGTAGIWRQHCIIEAGGWQHDTLTEDLDLSYRAQLKDWSFVFVNDILSPAELPIEMNAFKNQQHRWAKGSIQVARKLLPQILAGTSPLKIKCEAFFHLSANLAYLCMFVLLLIWPQMIIHNLHLSWFDHFLIPYLDFGIWCGACFSVLVFYAISQREVNSDQFYKRIKFLPAVIAVGIGLTLNNSKATLEALVGHVSAFVRTPKWALSSQDAMTHTRFNLFYRGHKGVLPYLEGIFALYYLYTIYYCILWQRWFHLPLLSLFFWGFMYVSYLSIAQWSFMNKSVQCDSSSSSFDS